MPSKLSVASRNTMQGIRATICGINVGTILGIRYRRMMWRFLAT